MNLATYLNQKYAASTAKSYLREIELFRTLVPDSERADYSRISAYLAAQRAKGYAPANLQRILASLKVYFDYLLHEEQVISVHPCRSMRFRDAKRKPEDPADWFTPEELRRLYEPRPERYTGLGLEIRNLVVIHLLTIQAATVGELAVLEVSHWNTERNTVFLKGSHKLNARELFLEPELQVPVLKDYMNQIRPMLASHPGACPGESLLLGKLGNGLTADEIHYLISTYGALFPNKRLNPRTIRRSVIRNLLEQYDVRTVEEFSGIKTLSAILRYRDPDRSKLLSQIDRYHPLQ